MKTIQSRSYGSFSRNILNKWLLYFALKEPVVPETRLTEQARTENEIRKKLENELKKFMDFSSAYTKTIITMAHREEKYDALEPPKQKLFDIWLTDQTGKALDLYWAPLSQIASQYASAPYSEILLNLNLQQQIDQYLQQINELIGRNKKLPGIFLFFDEITFIQYCPYTDVAFISIPFRLFETSPSLEDQLRGVAHELGHYLYWHMADFNSLNKQHFEFLNLLREKVVRKENENDWAFIESWVEEIFADVVGAWIGGEAFFESSKTLVLQRNGLTLDRIVENDNEHVPDILRPFVSSYTLFRKNIFPNAIDKWSEFTNQLGINLKDLRISGQSQNNREIRKSPDQLVEGIQITIDTILEGIQAFRLGKESPFNFNFPTSTELTEKATRIAKSAQGASIRSYTVLLRPAILEAGESGTLHTHRVGKSRNRPPSKHDHSNMDAFTHTHT